MKKFVITLALAFSSLLPLQAARASEIERATTARRAGLAFMRRLRGERMPARCRRGPDMK